MMSGEDHDENELESSATCLHEGDNEETNALVLSEQRDILQASEPPPCVPTGNGDDELLLDRSTTTTATTTTTTIDNRRSERRLAKNRSAAKVRRDKSRQHLSNLGDEHGRISEFNKILLAENAELKMQVSQMKLKIAISTRNGNIATRSNATDLPLPLTAPGASPVIVGGPPAFSGSGLHSHGATTELSQHQHQQALSSHHARYLQDTSSNYQHARSAVFPASAGAGDSISSWTSAADKKQQSQMQNQYSTSQQQATANDMSRMSAMLAFVQQGQSTSIGGRTINAGSAANMMAAGNMLRQSATESMLPHMGNGDLLQRARAELVSSQRQHDGSKNGFRFQDPATLQQAFRNHRGFPMNTGIPPSTNASRLLHVAPTNDAASRLLLANAIAEQQGRSARQGGIPPTIALQQQQDRRSEGRGSGIFPRQEHHPHPQQDDRLFEAFSSSQQQPTVRMPTLAAINNYGIGPFGGLPTASSLSTASQLGSQQEILLRMHTSANNSAGGRQYSSSDASQDQVKGELEHRHHHHK